MALVITARPANGAGRSEQMAQITCCDCSGSLVVPATFARLPELASALASAHVCAEVVPLDRGVA